MNNAEYSRLVLPGIIFVICACLLILSVILKKKVIKKHGLSDVNVRAPIKGLIALTALYVIFEILNDRWAFYPIIARIYYTLTTICFGWFTIKIINLVASLIMNYFDIKQKDNYIDRKVHTQVKVFKQLVIAFVVLFVSIGILMMFESVRSQGVKLLASAGVLRLVVGLAAQKTMGSLFGGIQFALSAHSNRRCSRCGN